jgi:Protein of unknown function (DUF2505)
MEFLLGETLAVQFSMSQPIAAPKDVVIDAFADPAFYSALGAVPNIGVPEVVSSDDDGTIARLAIRFRFTGHLAPAARRVLDPSRLTWVQQTTVDRAASRFEFHVVPDHYGDRLECGGRATFAAAGDTTTEHVEGSVVVHTPLVGRLVERAIISGLTEHLREQARVLETYSQ